MIPTVRRVVASSSAAAPPVAAAALGWSSAASTSTAPGQIRLSPSTRKQQPQPQQQQRRYSSSKPSSPDNGSKALPGVPSSSSSSSSSSSKPSSSSTSSSPKRRRKTKDSNSNSASASSTPTSTTTRPSVQKLPSVPSTQHLPAESLALSTFFSQHRPISITHSLPKIVSDDAFATIFAPRTVRNSGGGGGGGIGRTSDVIRTLSRAVHDLEGPMAGLSVNNGNAAASKTSRRQSKDAAMAAQHARQQLQQQLEEDAAAADSASGSQSNKIEFKNADGSDSGVFVQINGLSGSFMPFQPPPAPVPEMSAEQAAAEAISGKATDGVAEEAQAASADEMANSNRNSHFTDMDGGDLDLSRNTTTRVFRAVLTIEEQVDEHGEVHIVAHSPQILEEGDGSGAAEGESAVSQAFFERLPLGRLQQLKQLKRFRLPASSSAGGRMMAISVKRQRKLKMKKKKYKKLMRRTRTLRRKLDRT